MFINTHKQYLLKKFLKKIFLVSGIFLILILIINLIEEANFLKGNDTNFLTPVVLSSLNAPSLLYEMICQADEDTPSEYRTKHFRSTMSEGFNYLQKINYIKLNKGE